MKVLICDKPGSFQYDTHPQPAPSEGMVILRMRQAGVCGTDLHAFEGTQPYFSYPRILGHELAAEVVDAGGTSGISVGDYVTLMPYFSCGQCVACRQGKTNCCVKMSVFGVHEDGGFREFIKVPASAVVPGKSLGLDELAWVEPLAIGAHAVRRANISEGQRVLVSGAGPIGMAVATFAMREGAEVIVTDLHSGRVSLAASALNPAASLMAGDSLEEKLREITRGDMIDVVVDCTGSQRAIENAFRYLAHGGTYVLVGLQKNTITFSHPEFHKREATLMSSRNATRSDFDRVLLHLSEKKFPVALLTTHRATFDQLKTDFPGWLNPASGVLKAMVSFAN